MPMHTTLSDDKGQVFTTVPTKRITFITALAIIEFVILMIIAAVMIENIRKLEEAQNFSEKQNQRNAALSEMVDGRFKNLRWVFAVVCEERQRHNQECLATPKWYADPAKYPLLKDDPESQYLFPPPQTLPPTPGIDK